jgi:hypothetical protein
MAGVAMFIAGLFFAAFGVMYAMAQPFGMMMLVPGLIMIVGGFLACRAFLRRI